MENKLTHPHRHKKVRLTHTESKHQQTKVFCARENKMVLFFRFKFYYLMRDVETKGNLKIQCTWKQCYIRKKMKTIHTTSTTHKKTLLKCSSIENIAIDVS